MIIGLSGYAQAGKDTVAAMLVEDYGYTRLGFADIIKKACYALDPIINLDGMRLAHAVEKYGWDEVKAIPEVRRLLQTMGSEVGRDLIDPQIWVELTLFNVRPEDKIVIKSRRFGQTGPFRVNSKNCVQSVKQVVTSFRHMSLICVLALLIG